MYDTDRFIIKISSDAKDLNVLLDGIDKLVRLPYPAVIVAIANLYLDFPS